MKLLKRRAWRKQMEDLSDGIALPTQMGSTPEELTGEHPVVKVRPEKPLIRCKGCNVVATLPVCSLCTSRGFVPPEVAATIEMAAFVKPYDQDEETQQVPTLLPLRRPSPVTVAGGWRFNDWGKFDGA